MRNDDLKTALYGDITHRYLDAAYPEGACCGGPECGISPLHTVFPAQRHSFEQEFRFNEVCREVEHLRERVRALEANKRGVQIAAELNLEEEMLP